jgi:hypothetical protein
MWLRAAAETQIVPGSARASSRAAMLTPSPGRFSPSTTTSPTCMPMRGCIRSSAAPPLFSVAIAAYTPTAHWMASTALAKSAMTLSPAVLKIRPRCDAVSPSMMARRAFSRAGVPTSSRANIRTVAGNVGGEDRGQFALPSKARRAIVARAVRRTSLPAAVAQTQIVRFPAARLGGGAFMNVCSASRAILQRALTACGKMKISPGVHPSRRGRNGRSSG